MPTRAEMIQALQAHEQQQSALPSREEMIKALQANSAPRPEDDGMLKSIGKGALGVVQTVGETVDRFTGAPVRAAIGAIEDGANPAEAYMNQFGADPHEAPTGKEIAQKAGISDEALLPEGAWKKLPGPLMAPAYAAEKFGLTKSGAAGFGVDVAADPLNVVGAGAIKNVAAKGLGAVARGTVKGVEATAKATDALTGVRAATGALDVTKGAANTVGKVAESTKNAITGMLKPSRADDFSYMAGIAKKHGIGEEFLSPAHEFGERSSITRLQRNIAEGALGQKHLDQHSAGLMKTTQVFEDGLTKKFGHAPNTDDAAGAVLKDAVDGHISSVFDNADITYSSAAKQFPGLQIEDQALEALQSKAIGMKREAMRIARTSADPTQLAQAQNLERWSDLLLNTKGSYKEMAEIVQNVGKAAYAKTPLGQIPSDVKKLRELYDVGSESLIHSIRQADPAAADRLIVNNAEIKEMLGDKSMLGKVLQEAGDKKPEAIYQSLIKRGGSGQIETLRKILPEQSFNQLRSRYLQDLIKYQNDGVTINFGQTAKNMEKNAERLSYMFQPEELADATELLKFGERYGSPILSQSGTGGSQGFRGFGKNILMGAQDESALELMKNKARGVPGAPAAPASSAAPRAATNTPKPEAWTGRRLLRERGPGERRLKVAQSISPSMYQRPKKIGEEDDRKDVPKKGPAKWARDGFDKLNQHSPEAKLSPELLKDPKKRDLLIQASDLPPGSKAMQKILERIKS